MRDQFARTPALHQQARRNVHQQIAQEEDSRAEPDHRIAKAEVRLHLELGNANIGAVKISQQVNEHQVGNQSARNALASTDRQIVICSRCPSSFVPQWFSFGCRRTSSMRPEVDPS